ncbi:hypothetical protein BDY19DRAFT_588491 [Irpex rosettiformis]|uniref:Uncharacterized protein n=1 Tax=Irpex rosettiformis TaxID=378272 RepID=A0ACB8UE49_9APHY|nr:hypothetical protein BDY19DRAFT_588491 [Irpex rosettiformis]
MDSAGNYGTAACTALAIYEHFLTLDKEVRTVWQRPLKVNAASILLTLNRYAVLLYLFISIVDVDPDLGCTLLHHTNWQSNMLHGYSHHFRNIRRS